MQDLVEQLQKRRLKALAAVVAIAIAAVMFNFMFGISPSHYFDANYTYPIIYGLLIYKLVELLILYYLLMYRYVVKLLKNGVHLEGYPKIQKHTKLLYFLIPQGNTVFGFIAYKLSGEIKFFLIFSLIALIALVIIKPNSLKVTSERI